MGHEKDTLPDATLKSVSHVHRTSEVSRSAFTDKQTGHVFPNAYTMVNAYLERLFSTSLDATGYAQIKHGHAYVGINVVEEEEVLLVLAPMRSASLQEHSAALYRKLLELSFLSTKEAAFAIDAKTEMIYVRVLRSVHGLDDEELLQSIETVGRIAEEFREQLVEG